MTQRLDNLQAALQAAQRMRQSLFSGRLDSLTEWDLEQLAQDGMPGANLESSVNNLVDALVASNLAKSKTEARTFIQSGSVSINGAKIEALDHSFASAEKLFGRYSLLKRGKKNYCLINWQ